MKNITGFSFILLAFLAFCPACAGYVIGYYNYGFYPGDNLFCPGLATSTNNPGSNRLADLIVSAPNGTKVSLWNPATIAYGQTATFTGGVWSTNLLLPSGTGARLTTSVAFTNTFVGVVLNHDETLYISGNFTSPPAYTGPNGIFLLGDKCLVSATGAGIFTNILGRVPNVGEKISRFNASSQAFVTSTYLGAGNWDVPPTLALGEAAFFNIGPVSFLTISMPTKVTVQLSWSTNLPGSLQYATQLTAASWLAVTNAPVVSGSSNIVTLSRTNSNQRYFRLH